MNVRSRRVRGGLAWELCWVAGRDPGTGRPRRVYETLRGSRRDAERRWRERRDQLRAAPPAPDARQSLADWLAAWLAAVRPALRPTTAESYALMARVHIAPAIGAVRLEDLRPEHVRQMLDRSAARGCSPRTVAYARTVLRICLQEALRASLLRENPVDLVRPPRQSPKRVAAFSAPQAARLVAVSAGSRLGPLLDFAWRTGLRRGELLALRWSDVDLAGARLRVEQSRTKVRGGTALQAPKTGAGRRGLSLPASAVAALRRQADLQAADRAALGDAWQDSGLVFTVRAGGPLGPDRVSRDYRTLRDRAGLPPVPFHGLRHTAASLQLAAGAPVEVVSRRLGHRRISTTVDTYFHLLPESDRAAADALDAFLADAKCGD